jgi:DNA polymerase delta subunit 1
VGDRVPYIITRPTTKGQGVCDRAEDPMYVLKNNVPVDTMHYLENGLMPPIRRLFAPIFAQPYINAHFGEPCASCLEADAEPDDYCAPCKARYRPILKVALASEVDSRLFRGRHMLFRTTPPPLLGASAAASSLLRFAVRLSTCAGCRVPMSASGGPLCAGCAPKAPAVRARLDLALHNAVVAVEDLHQGCLRCAGTEENVAECAASDCPVYYTREYVAKRAASARALVTSLGAPPPVIAYEADEGV